MVANIIPQLKEKYRGHSCSRQGRSNLNGDAFQLQASGQPRTTRLFQIDVANFCDKRGLNPE
jgi:hypothetical protein